MPDLMERITVNPDIFGGKPIIRGHRLAVEHVLGMLAASRSPDAANAMIMGGTASVAQGQLNFNRDMEREADRLGFNLLTQAGFEQQGMVGMFQKLAQVAASAFGDGPEAIKITATDTAKVPNTSATAASSTGTAANGSTCNCREPLRAVLIPTTAASSRPVNGSGLMCLASRPAA